MSVGETLDLALPPGMHTRTVCIENSVVNMCVVWARTLEQHTTLHNQTSLFMQCVSPDCSKIQFFIENYDHCNDDMETSHATVDDFTDYDDPVFKPKVYPANCSNIIGSGVWIKNVARDAFHRRILIKNMERTDKQILVMRITVRSVSHHTEAAAIDF